MIKTQTLNLKMESDDVGNNIVLYNIVILGIMAHVTFDQFSLRLELEP